MARERSVRPSTRAPRPDFRDLGLVAVVALGGAAGTGARVGIGNLLPGTGSPPIAVVLINLSGAFLLGWLLARLRVPGTESRARRAIRLGIGTGVLGGYTTYSAFAVGADGALTMSDPLPGAALSLLTVAGGVLVAWCGSVVARLRREEEKER